MEDDIRGIHTLLGAADLARKGIVLQQELLQKSVNENTTITNLIKENTDDIVDLFISLRRAVIFSFRALRVVKWAGGFAAAIVAIVTLYQLVLTHITDLPSLIPDHL